MNAKHVLTTRDLAKDYGNGRGLAPTSLDVSAGELAMVVGGNGAGKSTLLGLCAGTLTPTGGSAKVLGHDAGTIPARAATCHVPDRPALYDDLTVWEQITYIAALHDASDWDDWADDLLDRLRMTLRRNELPTTFSRGQRQKAMLAVSLVRPFELLLLDEPFAGLDAPSSEALAELLRHVADQGAAVLVSTHQTLLIPHADRCIGLRDGHHVGDIALDEHAIREFVGG